MRSDDDAWLREVVVTAADTPPGRLGAFLDDACRGDLDVRVDVESLLAALREADACGFAAAPAESSARHAATATRVGRYRIVEAIGEGGMGTVYKAEQEHPVRRTVALKLIKLGMDTSQVVARFNAERQALAMMDHPHIARVFDAGASDTGRPYFVMELVDGVRITDYCDANRLTVCQRLELFVQVCQAVQHAHTKGVIHRDLKPSNVLVTTIDGRAVPKVIDFGIAKATQGRLTDQTLTTGQRECLGTPHYMSPEQADGGGDVDTRTDIYSLGVLLYETLAGAVPFDFGTAGSPEVQRIIRETDPPPPSARVATSDAGSSARGLDVRALRRELKGDLDRIVLKAMEKDRARRYETAAGLGLDVRRYLCHEPVTARQPNAVYRFRKLVRRNRLAVGSAAIVLTSLALAGAGLVYATVRDVRQREAHIKDLKEEHARTVEARGEAEAVNRFIGEMLDSASLHAFRTSDGDLSATQFGDTTVREMLDRASHRLEQGVLDDQPKVEAAVRMRLGQTYRGLGLLPAATDQFSRAHAIRLRLFGPDNLDVATTLNDLGFVLRFQGKPDAVEVLREALRVRRKLLGSENLAVAETLDNLGSVLGFGAVDSRGAEEAIREALRLKRKIHQEDDADVAFSLETLGFVFLHNGDLDGAEQELSECLRVRRKVLEETHPMIGRGLASLGEVLGWKGDLVRAVELQREALDVYRKRALDIHPEVGNAWNSLGLALESRGDYTGAEQAFRDALRIWSKTLGEGNPGRDAPRENLARVLQAKGDRSGAALLARECAEGDLGRVKKALAAKPNDPRLLARRAEVLARLGRFDSALRDYDSAISLDPKQYECWQQRACLRLYLGQDQPYRQECLQMLERWGETDDPFIGEAVGTACLLTPEPVGDPSVLRRLVDLRKTDPVAPWLEPWFQQARGLADYRSGDYGGAVQSLTDRRARYPYDSGYGRNSAVDFYLAMANYRLGHVREARDALARGIERTQNRMFQAGEGDLGHGGLVNWLACQIARREAVALIPTEASERAATGP